MVLIDVDARVPLAERVAYCAAQSRQILEHFAPRWGRVSSIRAATPDTPPRPREIQIRLLDQPTEDGAFGYHDQQPDGTPIAYVFVGLAREFGEEWTAIASHEVLELLADPLLHRCVQIGDEVWDLEIADRVEQESYGVDGVMLSNFNYPECFEPPPSSTPGTRYDHMGTSTGPNEIRPGGYAQRYDGRGWSQVESGALSAYRTKLAEHGLGRGAARRASVGSAGNWLTRLFKR